MNEVRPEFRYHSLRAQKARFTARFGAVWHVLVVLVAVALGLGGVWLLIKHGPVGWLMIGLVGPLAMLSVWWQGDLKTMAVSARAETIDDVTAADVLGRLSQRPSPKEIALAVGQ